MAMEAVMIALETEPLRLSTPFDAHTATAICDRPARAEECKDVAAALCVESMEEIDESFNCVVFVLVLVDIGTESIPAAAEVD